MNGIKIYKIHFHYTIVKAISFSGTLATEFLSFKLWLQVNEVLL